MDVALRLRKAREELVRFEQDVHEKMLARQKITEQVQEAERKLREIRALEVDMRLARSRLGRLDIELARLNMQKKRLEREVPNIESELRKIDTERKFRRPI